jgi:hypothetical protein
MSAMPRLKPLATVAACAALAPAAVACGGDSSTDASADTGASTSPAPSEAAQQLTGGRSVLELDSTVRRVLDLAGVDVSAVGRAKQVADGIAFPVVAGRLDADTPSGTIQHDGGIRFSAAGHDLTATNLLLRPGQGRITARVDGRRMPFLETTLGAIRSHGDTVEVPSRVKIGEGFAKELNAALGTKVLSGGLSLGRLTTEAERSR